MYIDRKKITPDIARRAARTTTVVLILIFLGMVFVYWNIQVLRYDYFRFRALQNIIKTVELEAPRGLILDRNRQVLAENRIDFTLYLIRESVTDWERTLKIASFLTGKSRSEIEKIIAKYKGNPKSYLIPLKDHFPLASVAYVESRIDEMPEFRIDLKPGRSYPQLGFGSHILGYISEVSDKELQNQSASGYHMGDSTGISGMEKQYERYLRGEKGTQTIIKDNQENVQQELSRVRPKIGQTLVLTVDLNLQRYIEELFQDIQGAAAVIDLTDGGIMALVSKPAFDPSIFSEAITPEHWNELMTMPDPPLRNKFIQGIYSPGSVFKIVMALTALSEGIITPQTSFFCGGELLVYDHIFHCAKSSGHGWMNLQSAIEKSCNIYFYNLGKRLQINTIARYARLLGLGETSRIDLPNEAGGLVPTTQWKERVFRQKWYAGETISVAIGEGSLNVTPVQMLRMISTVALRGRKPTPHLLDHIEKEGTTVYRFPANFETVPIPHALFEEVIAGMYRVVNGEGTGRLARVETLEICGKTGTSQIISKDNPRFKALAKEKRFIPNSWFACFAPREHPRIALVLLIENGGDAGLIAAPMAGQILNRIFQQ